MLANSRSDLLIDTIHDFTPDILWTSCRTTLLTTLRTVSFTYSYTVFTTFSRMASTDVLSTAILTLSNHISQLIRYGLSDLFGVRSLADGSLQKRKALINIAAHRRQLSRLGPTDTSKCRCLSQTLEANLPLLQRSCAICDSRTRCARRVAGLDASARMAQWRQFTRVPIRHDISVEDSFLLNDTTKELVVPHLYDAGRIAKRVAKAFSTRTSAGVQNARISGS